MSLPDFPQVKERVERRLLGSITEAVPQLEPLLGEIGGRFRQHEGTDWRILREREAPEELRDPKGYEEISTRLELSRDEMRTPNLGPVLREARKLAEQLGEQQVRLMLRRASEAAEAAGTTVSAGGELKPEHFLEMLRRKQVKFDPETGEPTGEIFVVHQDMLPILEERAEEWENDPDFVEERERIMEQKRMEWRAREGRRKLVN